MVGRHGQDGNPHPELRRVIDVMQARYPGTIIEWVL